MTNLLTSSPWTQCRGPSCAETEYSLESKPEEYSNPVNGLFVNGVMTSCKPPLTVRIFKPAKIESTKQLKMPSIFKFIFVKPTTC